MKKISFIDGFDVQRKVPKKTRTKYALGLSV
jgi:hypothetical protein